MVEGGMKCIKYLLFAFNFTFFVAGLALIIVGAVVQAKFAELFDIIKLDASYNSVAILLIVVGCIIFIIGFFGCCGAVKENYCMVMTFAILLSVIFILEIAAGIAGFVTRNKVEVMLKKGMTTSIGQYNETTQKAWDQAQRRMECCGVEGPTDWNKILGKYPPSCCKTDACTAGPFKDGCLKKFKTLLEDNVYIIAGIGIGLAFVQIVGVIFACCLARSIKKEYEVV